MSPARSMEPSRPAPEGRPAMVGPADPPLCGGGVGELVSVCWLSVTDRLRLEVRLHPTSAQHDWRPLDLAKFGTKGCNARPSLGTVAARGDQAGPQPNFGAPR